MIVPANHIVINFLVLPLVDLQVIKTSLIPQPLGGRGLAPAVSYCSALPKTQYEIPYPAYMSYYTGFMASIAGQCSTGSRRAAVEGSGNRTAQVLLLP